MKKNTVSYQSNHSLQKMDQRMKLTTTVLRASLKTKLLLCSDVACVTAAVVIVVVSSAQLTEEELLM